jgi:4-amino-4-deoxy-L-arabinose transferase-like glycosyltransferase
MQKTESVNKYLPWAALGVFTLLVLAFKMGGYPLTDNDEALYSQVAKELLGRKDWWTLYWHNEPWFIHAPLSMWIQAACFKLFGISEVSARLNSLIFGFGLVYLTAAFGARLFNRRTGIVAGFILASSPIFFATGKLAILDATLAFFVTLAIFAFIVAWEKKDWRLYPVFWLSAGFATLNKGLWGLVLPCMICFLYAITGSNRKRLLNPVIYISALLWAAVVMPWFIIEAQRHGALFLEPTLSTNTYARLTTAVCNHQGPWYFYLVIIAAGFFPWVLLWPKSFIKDRGDAGRLLWLWILPPLVLFSIAKTKLPNYIVPMLPAFAILIAASVTEAKSRKIQGIATVSIGIAAAIASFFCLKSATAANHVLSAINPLWVAGVILVAYSIAGAALIKNSRLGPAVMAVMLGATLCLFPNEYTKVHRYFSPKQTAIDAAMVADGGPVYTINGIRCEYGLFFYSRPNMVVARDLKEFMKIIPKRADNYALVVSPNDAKILAEHGIKLKVCFDEKEWLIGKIDRKASRAR